MAAPRNLVNLKDVRKGYASRTILEAITLGVGAGDRVGIVGRNGDGKSTLLKLIAGLEEPDGGALTRERGLRLALLHQDDELHGFATVRDALVGERADHEWAADAGFRAVLDGLLGGTGLARLERGMDTPVAGLSGGERRRIALARLLLEAPELLLLDEPTNHLDVEAVDWLAAHLAARRGALLVVTHDRWFLDAVCTTTWEVSDGAVHEYEGGYAAYVLARAERERQAAASEERRQNLLRKELAWLRRGPQARTTKPKFRVEAANALIADEPPLRDRAELMRFATQRLGAKVLEAEDVRVAYGAHEVLRGVTWRLGPGDRVALVGVNGSGKSTLLRVLGDELAPDGGFVQRGQTVRLAHLSQDTAELNESLTVLGSLEEVRGAATLADGHEITASLLCDRFGFRGARARTPVADLSGGERRRLGLMRLLMGGPNVLLLDEPTNDLDIDTLTALEDLLDGWPGTLVVVSHDRWFVERVCDDVYALAEDGTLDHLPGGIEAYVAARRAEAGGEPGSRARAAATPQPRNAGSAPRGAANPATGDAPSAPRGAVVRAARKDAQRAERDLERLAAREAELHEAMVAAASDHVRLGELQAELDALVAQRDAAELAWLSAAEALDG